MVDKFDIKSQIDYRETENENRGVNNENSEASNGNREAKVKRLFRTKTTPQDNNVNRGTHARLISCKPNPQEPGAA